MTFNKSGGFSLIEIMVVAALISVMAAFAIPTYKDYIIRSKITQAISGLSARQVRMEQCYQDNRTYSPPSPCQACPPTPVIEGDFEFSCEPETNTFMLTATGRDAMIDFVYTVNQSDEKTSSAPAGWGSGSNCWITKKGGAC
jgi:type IV pilus assembly protein PilE